MPAVILRALLREQPFVGEAAQDAAEIAVIEVERGGEFARGHLLAMRQLIEHAPFGEGKAGVNQPLLQQSELARVEARKAAHSRDAGFQVVGGIRHQITGSAGQ